MSSVRINRKLGDGKPNQMPSSSLKLSTTSAVPNQDPETSSLVSRTTSHESTAYGRPLSARDSSSKQIGQPSAVLERLKQMILTTLSEASNSKEVQIDINLLINILIRMDDIAENKGISIKDIYKRCGELDAKFSALKNKTQNATWLQSIESKQEVVNTILTFSDTVLELDATCETIKILNDPELFEKKLLQLDIDHTKLSVTALAIINKVLLTLGRYAKNTISSVQAIWSRLNFSDRHMTEIAINNYSAHRNEYGEYINQLAEEIHEHNTSLSEENDWIKTPRMVKTIPSPASASDNHTPSSRI